MTGLQPTPASYFPLLNGSVLIRNSTPTPKHQTNLHNLTATGEAMPVSELQLCRPVGENFTWLSFSSARELFTLIIRT